MENILGEMEWLTESDTSESFNNMTEVYNEFRNMKFIGGFTRFLSIK